MLVANSEKWKICDTNGFILQILLVYHSFDTFNISQIANIFTQNLIGFAVMVGCDVGTTGENAFTKYVKTCFSSIICWLTFYTIYSEVTGSSESNLTKDKENIDVLWKVFILANLNFSLKKIRNRKCNDLYPQCFNCIYTYRFSHEFDVPTLI